jgi:hypothetical protein
MMEDILVDLEELFAGRAAQTNPALEGHIAAFGAKGNGKTELAASIATTNQYTDTGFIQAVAHTVWFSHHTGRRKPREYREREPLTFCIDQCDDGLISFHWGGGYIRGDQRPRRVAVRCRRCVLEDG